VKNVIACTSGGFHPFSSGKWERARKNSASTRVERFILVGRNIARTTEISETQHQEISIMDFRVRPGEMQEDQVTALLERYCSKLPTGLFLGAAMASVIGSMVLKLQGRHLDALFVGQWVAPFLILALYNKAVKQHGSDTERWGRLEPV
jgi:hypothetical protein